MKLHGPISQMCYPRVRKAERAFPSARSSGINLVIFPHWYPYLETLIQS